MFARQAIFLAVLLAAAPLTSRAYSAAHAVLGNVAYEQLQVVPVPAALPLLLSGLGLLGFIGSRRAA